MCERHVFEFNLAEAYSTQAVAQFEASPKHPLTATGAPKALGVYALYLTKADKSPVYVGKATKITLARRLAEHATKIGGRQNIDVTDVWCRYLVIGAKPGEQWVATSAEAALIHHYKPKWNKSGFGGHVPGAGRPGKDAVPWDVWHPKK
jgi:predicted GIY-YIG superfamily endonuclease